MAEYIEREACISFLEDAHEDKDWLVNQYNADWICSWIESQPAADVVEVVHCRECVVRDCCELYDIFHVDGYEDPFCCMGKRGADNAGNSI